MCSISTRETYVYIPYDTVIEVSGSNYIYGIGGTNIIKLDERTTSYLPQSFNDNNKLTQILAHNSSILPDSFNVGNVKQYWFKVLK